MSSPLGTKFGAKNGGAYEKVLKKWGKRLVGVEKISEPMKKEWAADLQAALEKDLITSLTTKGVVNWKRVGKLPSQDEVKDYAKSAIKDSLSKDMFDLLERLRLMAQEEDTFNESEDSLTAAIKVDEALKRVGQTVAQIFDMVSDKFNDLMFGFFRRSRQLTGRRRWRTVGTDSRHAELDGQERSADQDFTYKGESIYGPRPPGGSPANWSNCSCYLVFEKSNGEWVRIS